MCCQEKAGKGEKIGSRSRTTVGTEAERKRQVLEYTVHSMYMTSSGHAAAAGKTQARRQQGRIEAFERVRE
jgi:hypothetical protein